MIERWKLLAPCCSEPLLMDMPGAKPTKLAVCALKGRELEATFECELNRKLLTETAHHI